MALWEGSSIKPKRGTVPRLSVWYQIILKSIAQIWWDIVYETVLEQLKKQTNTIEKRAKREKLKRDRKRVRD